MEKGEREGAWGPVAVGDGPSSRGYDSLPHPTSTPLPNPSLTTLVQAHCDRQPGGPAALSSQVWPPTLESSRWATKVAKALHTLHCFSEQVSSEATWMPTWRGRVGGGVRKEEIELTNPMPTT